MGYGYTPPVAQEIYIVGSESGFVWDSFGTLMANLVIARFHRSTRQNVVVGPATHAISVVYLVKMF